MICPDLPGFGGSGDLEAGLTVDKVADVLADFLDAVGATGPVVVGGLSMGGYVALAFARRQPQRLRGLILADTKAESDDEAAKAGRDAMMHLARQGGAAGVVEKMLPKLLGRTTRESRPGVAAEVRRIGLLQKADAVVAALMMLKDRPDALPGLANVVVPTLIVVGAEDELTPPERARVMHEHVAGSRLVTIPAAGHLSNLEAPQAFDAAVRAFL